MTQLLTCEETAELLRVSVETVRNLASAGELPGSKIGRAWRFPKSEIDALLRSNAKPRAAENEPPPVASPSSRSNSQSSEQIGQQSRPGVLPETEPARHSEIDADALLARCMGNLEFAQSMLQEMEETTLRHLESIRECAAEKNSEGISQAAHSLKGAAGIICAGQLGQAAAKLEEASSGGQEISELEPLIGSVSSAAESCLASIPNTLRHHSQRSMGV